MKRWAVLKCSEAGLTSVTLFPFRHLHEVSPDALHIPLTCPFSEFPNQSFSAIIICIHSFTHLCIDSALFIEYPRTQAWF